VTGMGRWHVLGVALVGLVLLGAGTLLDGWLPDGEKDPAAAPHVRQVEVGEPADLRTMQVQVERVRVSRELDESGTELLSPGVWVLVEYTVVATRENTSVGFVELRDGGRVWSLVGRNGDTCQAGPPGVPVSCAAYFEVPPDALDGLRLRLARDFSEQRFDALAEVDLGLTDQDAALPAGAPALEVPGSTIVGTP